MNKIALPATGAGEVFHDLLQRGGKACLHQFVRDGADRVLLFPSVQMLCRWISEGDHIVHIADEHCVVGEVKESPLLRSVICAV